MRIKSDKKSFQELRSVIKKDVTVDSVKCTRRLRRLRSQALSKIHMYHLSPVQSQAALVVLERRQKTPEFALVRGRCICYSFMTLLQGHADLICCSNSPHQ